MVPLDGLPASFPHLSILFHYGTPPLTSLVFHITKSPTLNTNTKWLLSAPTGTQGEPHGHETSARDTLRIATVCHPSQICKASAKENGSLALAVASCRLKDNSWLDRQPLWLGIENPASGAGGSASTAGLRASEGTMVWAAGTYRTWQLDQPRICEATLQSLTGTHGTAPLQRRKSRQTRTLRDLRTIAGAADEAADGTRGNLMVNTRQRTGRCAPLPS